MPTTYSRPQIILHWLVFIIIALQFLLKGPMSAAWEQIEQGLEFTPHPAVFGHVIGGVLVLLFALWRIYLRFSYGAPALPQEEPPLQQLAAKGTHLGLYVLMVLTPITGAAAWFGGVMAAAEGHEVMKTLLLILIALHLLGALYQQFVLKTNIMARMRFRK